MVEADQVENGQSAAFLDVRQGLVSERDSYLGRMTDVIGGRRAITEPLDVKPRRHGAPTPYRFLIPVLP